MALVYVLSNTWFLGKFEPRLYNLYSKTCSWTPGGKVTISWMLYKCLPVASQECFGMFLASLSAISFCTIILSHLAHAILAFPMVLTCCSQDRQSLLPLEVTVWPSVSKENRQPSSLLPSCAFSYVEVVHAVPAINSEQMNQTVLQSVRGNKIFDWAVCKWIFKLDISFGSLTLCCQASRQPFSRRLCYSYIENYFIGRGFSMAVEIFEQISREQRPCWQFWFTGCMVWRRGMLNVIS